MFNKIYHIVVQNLLFIIILCLGILLRILWVLNVPTIPVSDFSLFYNGAQSISNGFGFLIYGYHSAYEPIGYPLFLAILFKVFGSSLLVAKIANVALSCINLIFVYLITKVSLKKKLYALIAMFLFAILPLHIIYTSVLSTEIIFTTFLLIITYIIMLPNTKFIKYISLGVLLGLSALIKPYMMVFQFAIFTLDLIETKRLKQSLINFLIISIFIAVTVAPWTIRNYTVFHKFIPISTNGGYNLYVNNNPYATGSWQNPFKIHNSPLAIYKHTYDDFWDEIKVDQVGKQYASNWIIHNPISFVKVGLLKLNNVFLKYDDGYWSTMKLENNKTFTYASLFSKINKGIHLITIFFIIVFFITLILKLSTHKPLNHLSLVILMNISFYVLITFVFEGQPRYLFPLWPLFIICVCSIVNKILVLVNSNS